MTPMMRQYYELKKQCQDAILLFRMGDFYEMFGADAELVSGKLDLVLTSRERGDQKRIPFCGVPFHSARTYWLKLLRLGFRVAVADQVENAADAKGLVRREIVKLLSPGCIADFEGLQEDRPNYTMAFLEDPKSALCGVALADVSTGEFRSGVLQHRQEFDKLIANFYPKELLTRKFEESRVRDQLGTWIQDHGLIISHLPESSLRDADDARSMLATVFGRATDSDREAPVVSQAKAALLQHFQHYHINLSVFRSCRPLVEAKTMDLSHIAIRDLELFETARTRRTKGSLFSLINHTCSPMGARLLRWNLAHPHRDLSDIQSQHESIQSFVDLGIDTLKELRTPMAQCFDLARLNARVVHGEATPQDLHRLRCSLEACTMTATALSSRSASPLTERVCRGLLEGNDCQQQLTTALSDVGGSLGKGSEVFRHGFDSQLDEQVALSKDGMLKVEQYQDQLRRETGISSLKIKPHKSFGLLIEVTKSNLAKVPAHFIRRQTMVNNERFVTEELKDLDEAISGAHEKAILREYELYRELLERLRSFQSALDRVATTFAQLDVMQSQAWLAITKRYVRPSFSPDHLRLEGSRHPVVEAMVGEHDFTPNLIELENKAKIMLITGPNMAGKSTVMRQVALSAILCQSGGFVPATQAIMPIFDQIFTRVGASDDLSQGLSTFMVEMTESAQIMRHATADSLVILDEVGRGTSTEDGVAIASAILEYLAVQVSPWTLFATHFHELVQKAEQLEGVTTKQTAVVESEGGISFSHLLTPGACHSSFGIEVARLAGMPDIIVEEAKRHLKKKMSRNPGPPPTRSLAPARLADPSADAIDLVSKLQRIDLNRMNPIQALTTLAKLQQHAKSPEKFSQPGLFHDRQT